MKGKFRLLFFFLSFHSPPKKYMPERIEKERGIFSETFNARVKKEGKRENSLNVGVRRKERSSL